ncbi:site-specific tyrosine recombinase XerC [Porphyromonas macacae]|uniref:Site-specific tyrosine recombinase XerC n=2 Tax=Porphyromonas macacae TaxID=28115 RepID=A0A379DJ79_9PORP|nr:tyrosine-type recombinase/integrase [Porphyromonas macacae]SUB78391.1 site-specific tyrosine recombinase XerC [Porphyromonas macacae]
MKTTFAAVAQLWSQAKQPLVKYSTMCAYRLTLRSHLLPRFGQMTQIAETDVQNFIIDKINKGLSKKTVRDIVAVLRAIIKYGARQNIFESENWQLRYPTIESGSRLPILSLKHQRKLMTYLIEQPNSRNIGILLSLCTGMRIGEVCALEWSCVDLSHRILRIRQTVARIYDCEKGATEQVFSTPKTKHSFREIPMSRHLFEALCTVKKHSVSSFVVGSSISAIDPRTYRDYFTRVLKQLQIPPIVFHTRRHREFYKRQIINRLCCSLIKGGNDKETSKLLYSTLFCHFKEPLFSFAKILFSKQKDKYLSTFLLVIHERYLSLEAFLF